MSSSTGGALPPWDMDQKLNENHMNDRFESALEIPPALQLWVFPRGVPRPVYMVANTLACDGYAVSKFTGIRVEYTDQADRDDAERVAKWLRCNGWKRTKARFKIRIVEAGA